MHDAEGVFYFLAHADKKAVLDFCIMHGKENRKMCFPGIASSATMDLDRVYNLAITMLHVTFVIFLFLI